MHKRRSTSKFYLLALMKEFYIKLFMDHKSLICQILSLGMQTDNSEPEMCKNRGCISDIINHTVYVRMLCFAQAPCAHLQVVRLPYWTVIPLCTWCVTRQSCSPSIVPKRVEFYTGTTLSASLLVHLSACPRGLDVWRRRCTLFTL